MCPIKLVGAQVDFPGGDESALKKSLKIISELPEDIIAYPGNGDSTHYPVS